MEKKNAAKFCITVTTVASSNDSSEELDTIRDTVIPFLLGTVIKGHYSSIKNLNYTPVMIFYGIKCSYTICMFFIFVFHFIYGIKCSYTIYTPVIVIIISLILHKRTYNKYISQSACVFYDT